VIPSRDPARDFRRLTPYQRELARFARETPAQRRARMRDTINNSNLARHQRFIDNNLGTYTGLAQLNTRLSTMNNLTDLQSLLTTAHTHHYPPQAIANITSRIQEVTNNLANNNINNNN
jgi:hypothetical protein